MRRLVGRSTSARSTAAAAASGAPVRALAAVLLAVAVLLAAALLAGCGGSTKLFHKTTTTQAPAPTPATSTTTSATAGQTGTSTGANTGSGTPGSEPAPKSTSTPAQLGFPYLATKNTTRIPGNDPISDAAAVALATFPSTLPGTHPTAVALAPTGDWQAALASASLMAPPFRAPALLSTPSSLPTATANALKLLAPTGDHAAGGAQVIRVGDVPTPKNEKTASITGANAYALAAAIDSFEARERGRESVNVVIASAQYPQYAMPAAGYAAESGEPILYVNSTAVPAATQEALLAHHHPHIYVLGPPSVIPDSVLHELAVYGIVKRITGDSPAALSVAFAEYRDPPCPTNGQQCAHVSGSFGWAARSPGRGYVVINQNRTLDALAAAPLSSSGSYGPQLLVQQPNTLPKAVLNYLVAYATPGYSSEGPTAAVYDHAWLIGGVNAISEQVQGQLDSLLEVVAAK
jgi:hypothetical protein